MWLRPAVTTLNTVSGIAAELPPPGELFDIVTGDQPMAARFAAGTVAVICVLLTSEATSIVLPSWTVVPLTKPVPFSVNVVSAEPALIAAGLMEDSTGGGL